MTLKILRKRLTNLSIFVFLGFLMGCGSDRRNPNDPGVDAYQYPHPTNWSALHVETLSSTDGVKADVNRCLSCHKNTEKAMTLGESVSCGSSCHTKEVSASTASQLKSVVSNECQGCHKPDAHHESNHYPALAGLCSICHKAEAAHLNGSDKKAVSTLSANETCYRCHTKNEKAHLHKPVEGGQCSGCHDVHGSPYSKLLKTSTPQLCLNCHKQVPHEGKSVHAVIKDQKNCTNCHRPHSSDQIKLLTAAPKPLCLSCHNREISTESLPIANIAEKLKSKSVHFPAENENCTDTCHKPHATDFDRLLTGNFPTTSYFDWDGGPNAFGLCMGCHEEAIVKEEIKGSETQFRNDTLVNGEIKSQNLHYFHVKGSSAQSRSCKVCHDPHGSDQAHSVRTSWQMGHFSINLKYEATATGGSCSMTCHGEKTYNRLK
jgi:predicted CXXCH cytochrome family protein